MSIIAKYVMNGAGHFALISKMSGMYHDTLGDYIEGPIVRAGFATLFDGKLETYGESTTLSLRADSGDAGIIMAALEAGEVLKNFDTACFCESWVTFNDPASKGKAEAVSGLEELISLKVLRG